jgi:hypothetical protein
MSREERKAATVGDLPTKFWRVREEGGERGGGRRKEERGGGRRKGEEGGERGRGREEGYRCNSSGVSALVKGRGGGKEKGEEVEGGEGGGRGKKEGGGGRGKGGGERKGIPLHSSHDASVLVIPPPCAADTLCPPS